jgi:hypothetical protein
MTMHTSDAITTMNLTATAQDGRSGAKFEIIHDLAQPGMVTIRFTNGDQVWTAPASFEEVNFMLMEAHCTERLAGVQEHIARH